MQLLSALRLSNLLIKYIFVAVKGVKLLFAVHIHT